MGISENRLGLLNDFDVSTSNYTTASDTARINDSRSLSESYTEAQVKTIMDPPTYQGSKQLSTSLGIFDNLCNSSALGTNLRTSNHARNGNSLNYGGNNSTCTMSRAKSGLDSALGSIDSLANINNYKSYLSGNLLTQLTDYINMEAMSLFGGTIGTLIAVPVCLISSILNGILSALGNIGSSLGLKNLLNSFLNNFTTCISKALSSVSGQNSSITSITTGSIINQLSTTSTPTASSMLDTMVASGASQDTMMSGFNYSLSQKDDTYTENKLALLNGYYDSTNSNRNTTSISSVYTTGIADNVISNIDNTPVDNRTTLYPTGVYTSLETALDNVDSTWYKDNNGDTNLYRTVGNSRLASLAESAATSNNTTNITGETITSIDRATAIYILNATA